jgi:hypothetical protein
MLSIEEIRRLLAATTPGRWEHVHFPNSDASFVCAPRLSPDHPYDIEIMSEDRGGDLYPSEQAHADGDWIAQSKDIVQQLLARIEELEALIETHTA